MATRETHTGEGERPQLFTIGTGGKSAEEFFGLLKRTGIERLIDIRLHNTSQLAGFTKKDDLRYFLSEICHTGYIHETKLSPTDELMESYKKREIDWPEYERIFTALLVARDAETLFGRHLFAEKRTILLCSEPRPDRCHRRIAAEYLSEKFGLIPLHL